MAPRRKGGPLNTLYSYKGVRQRSWGKGVAEIRVPEGKKSGKCLWLGTFNTSQEAVRVYNEKSLELYGDNAPLNLILPGPAPAYGENLTGRKIIAFPAQWEMQRIIWSNSEAGSLS
ncbi:hypothetical protein R1sor_024798 [Riccia sorocarpa]|uniref:AP2/ERF domain-containing protein n=1 Tax=Riccia sorocarpa TaxID=122646 RepID=A0ABD3GRH3_9MARC